MTRRSKPKLCQQGHEEEKARDARAKRAAGREVQLATVRDFGRIGARPVLGHAGSTWTSASVREKKGGVTPRRQSATKTTSHRSQRRGFVAEPFGDLVERFAFDEDRAEGLVLSLEGLFGLEEESAGVGPIHDAGSRKLIIFGPGSSTERTPKIRVEKGSRPPSLR